MLKLPGSVRDERAIALESVIDRLADIDAVMIYAIDTVDSSALPHLAEQFNVTGLRGWVLAETELQQRALLKEAIALHKKAATPYAVLRSLTLVGYPAATISENPPLLCDGSWACNGDEYCVGQKIDAFVITLDSTQSAVSSDKVSLIIALINEWKNVRTRLIDLRIGNISLFSNLLLCDGMWLMDGSQEADGELNI